MSNGEKIRNMTDEELAEFLVYKDDYYEAEAYAGHFYSSPITEYECDNPYEKAIKNELEWLKSEVSE